MMKRLLIKSHGALCGHTSRLRALFVLSATTTILCVYLTRNLVQVISPPAQFTHAPEDEGQQPKLLVPPLERILPPREQFMGVSRPRIMEQAPEKDYWATMRIAIMLTTHLSDDHLFALEHCWPSMVNRSKMLQNADIFLLTTNELNETIATTAFNQTRGVVQTKVFLNPGYQEGAMLKMKAVIENKQKWFGGYDWIIRLNPDVFVLDDEPFLPHLQNKNLDAILVNCWRRQKILPHTDFFAIRPRALPNTTHDCDCGSAESHFRHQIRHVMQSGRYLLLPGVSPLVPRICRAHGNIVLHDHNFTRVCTKAFEEGAQYKVKRMLNFQGIY